MAVLARDFDAERFPMRKEKARGGLLPRRTCRLQLHLVFGRELGGVAGALDVPLQGLPHRHEIILAAKHALKGFS